jgi:hypothetical protein
VKISTEEDGEERGRERNMREEWEWEGMRVMWGGRRKGEGKRGKERE